MVSTEKLLALREWYGNPNLACLPIAGAAAAAVVAALDELLAYREGYDPQERLPDLGQWTVIEPVDVRDNEPPCVVAQWVNAPQEAIDGWVCDREPDAQLWFVDLGGLFNWWAASDVRRWYPIPGGA
jgi:hypothetical protein